MLLQRDRENAIWGYDVPGQSVTVMLGGRTQMTTAGADGRWQASVEPPPAGGPYELRLDGPQHLEFHDVLVGDVWLCSGQSNMEFNLASALDGTAAVKDSTHDTIRLFRVANQAAYAPVEVPRVGKAAGCALLDLVDKYDAANGKTFSDLIRATTATPAFVIRANAP